MFLWRITILMFLFLSLHLYFNGCQRNMLNLVWADFAEVISTSMRQLLPYEGHLCGIAKSGFYPEVVQHTNWDYGKNGKGYYNDIFAPGWTVASLWELLTRDVRKGSCLIR